MTSLHVNVLQKNKSKNSFGNSFVFSDDLISQNEFVLYNENQENKVNEKDKNINSQVFTKGKIVDQSKQKVQNNQNASIETNPIKKNKKHKENQSLANQLKEQLFVDKPQKKQPVIQSKNKNQKFQNQKQQQQQNLQFQEKQQKTKNKANNKNRKHNDKNRNNQTIQIDTQVPKMNKNISNISKPIKQEDDQIINQKDNKNRNHQKSKNTQDYEHHQRKQNKIKYKSNDKVIQIQQQSEKESLKTPQNIKQNKVIQKFQSKVTQIHTNINKLSNNLKDIKQNYADIDKFTQDEILFKKSDRKKQRQIRDFLMQKRIEKQNRQKKLKQVREKEKQLHQKTMEQTEEIKRKQKQQKIKKIKQIDFVKPKERHKKYIQSQKSGRQLAKSLVQRFKNNEPFHVRKQREFQTLQQKRRAQNQELLQQRKQRYQSLDLDELEQHKREYEQRKQQWENNRKQQRQQQWNKIQEDNALLRDNIWKGPSHDIVDEELMEKKRKKQQPKEKAKRIKNYQEFIKNNYIPKTHQPKRSDPIVIHNQRIAQSMGNYAGKYHIPSDGELAHYDPRKRHVKKYRYFQGKAIGEVVESVPVARSYSQQKKIGQSYLQYLKQLPKKQIASQTTTQIDSVDLQMISKKFNAVTKVKRQAVPFYQQSGKKKTVSISQKPSKQQVKMVYEQLKNHDIKLKSKQKLIRAMKQNSPGSMDMEKQVNSDLILNMERKLDLLAKI